MTNTERLTNWIDRNHDAIAKRLPANPTEADVEAAMLAEIEAQAKSAAKFLNAPAEAQGDITRAMYHLSMCEVHGQQVAQTLRG